MTAETPLGHNPRGAGAPRGDGRSTQDPEWAAGLRRLYDSVVDEPLPDSFMDLLSQLDAKD